MKGIFTANGDIYKTAYMNWRTNPHQGILNMIVMADGFMQGALLIAKSTIDDNMDHKADCVIFPMLFNVNHAIELYLKATVWTLNIILCNGQKIEGKHDIQQILQVLKVRVNEYETALGTKENKKQFKELISNVESYINELFEKIGEGDKRKKDNMDFSRYPFDQQYNSHFYITEVDNVEVDLENFIERFTEINKNLKLISEYYYYHGLLNDF